jgi:hypothetical protein
MQTFDQSLLGLYREDLITYETARDAATNPDDFDLKVRGIFSTGEMTWETGAPAPDPASPAPAPAAAAGNGARAASPFKRR